LLTFSCNLNVPRTVDAVGMPSTWAHDDEITFAARGLLGRLIDVAEPGAIVDEEYLGEPGPDDPSIESMVRELVQAGYLVPSQHFRVVYPARLLKTPEGND
jgi:hypothetical protein